MKYYYFYKPETAKIIGMSDSPHTLNFPYIESEEEYHSFDNLRVLGNKIVPIKVRLTPEDTEVKTHKPGKLDKIREKIMEKKEKGEEMKQGEMLNLFLEIINNV